MNRLCLYTSLAAMLFAAVPAQRSVAADAQVSGLIVARTPGGYWARFARPVAEGGTVRIRAHQDGPVLSTAKIQWSSPVPPFDAYLVAPNPPMSPSNISTLTPYDRLIHESPLAGYVDRGQPITAGYFVSAAAGTQARYNDVLRGMLDLLEARPEFRDYLRTRNL